MKKLGEWLKIYGKGIYETRPYESFTQSGWYFTYKQNSVFAFHKNTDDTLCLNLAQFPAKIKKIINMETNQTLTMNQRKVVVLQKSPFVGVQIKLEENL
ncbi:MAG: hypothetical protein L0H27_07435 [Tetragenococcus halophilus]|nr:hypothetical protein [Tetragenococcus halophilus]